MYQVAVKACLNGSKLKPYTFIVEVDDIISAISKVSQLAEKYGEDVFKIYDVESAKKVIYQHILVGDFDSTKWYYRVVNSSITPEGKAVTETLLVYCEDNSAVDIAKEYLKDNSYYDGEAIAISQVTQLNVTEFIKANALDIEYIKQYETSEEND